MSDNVLKFKSPSILLSEDVIKVLVEKANDIKSCSLVVEWNDGNITSGHSHMDASMLMLMGHILTDEAMRIARGD